MSDDLRSKPLKYHRIAADLRDQLVSMDPGSRLPSERVMAEQFGCNVLTLRKSLASLAEEGLIERRMGSGTFVAEPPTAPAKPQPAAPRKPAARGTAIGALALAETDRYGQLVIQALGRMATQRGLDLRVSWVQALDDTAVAQAAAMQAAGCGSLVLPWFPHSQLQAAAEFVRQSPLPASLPMLIPGLERNCFESPKCFGTNTLLHTSAVAHYFAEQGYRRIALLGPAEAADPILQAKLSAYACAMAELGRDNLTGLVGPTGADVDALAARWQAHGDLAVISYDDTHAMRFMTAMHKLGKSAPEDFVIIGANDDEACRTCDPPLSSLCQDFDYIGGWLLRSAQALARGEVDQSATPSPCRVAVRVSCGALDRMDDRFIATMRTRGLALVAEADPVYA